MKIKDLADLYRLSPVQEGMIFHSLFAPASDVYFRQHSCTLQGDLDRRAFGQAWERIISRHPILRTSFHWEGLDRPLQMVHHETRFHIEQDDWRGLSQSEQQRRLTLFESAQRSTPFNLSQPPLMRLALFRLTDDTHRFICSYHHLLMDGWSKFVLLKELFAFYQAFSRKQDISLAEPPLYRDYIAWLQQQNMEEAEEYWRQLLKGFAVPTTLAYDRTAGEQAESGSEYESQKIQLSGDLTEKLQLFARRHQLTLSTILQGAWALLLSHFSQKNDVVFGVTVSGRPTDLAGIETMVGVFINTLPVRVRISSEESLVAWLKELQSQLIRTSRYAYTSLGSIKKWSDVQRNQQLFESILVFGNYPIDISVKEPNSGLRVRDNQFYEKSNYPLGLAASPGSILAPQFHYDCRRFTATRIIRLLRELENLLEWFISRPGERTGTFLNMLADTRNNKTTTMKINKKEDLASIGPKSLKPRPIKLSAERLVRTGHLNDEEKMPLVVQPKIDGVCLISWIKGQLNFVESELLKHGAIYFRGFKVESISRFEQFVSEISPQRLEYYERTVRRRVVGDKLYTASEYPADHPIPLHNEYSFSHIWPMKLWFYCVKSAERGGETAIADGRKVFNLISPKVRERFTMKKVMYIRNYGDGFDLSWQDVFQTTDKQAVEQYCRQARIEFEWKSGGRLRTRQVRQAVATHPKTREIVWFNQANLFHVTSLEAAASESLLSLYDRKEDNLPRHAFYGDGSPIEAEALEDIREAYQKSSTLLSLNEGDILMIDNMIVAHGRAPFIGMREVVVAMAETNTFPVLQERGDG